MEQGRILLPIHRDQNDSKARLLPLHGGGNGVADDGLGQVASDRVAVVGEEQSRRFPAQPDAVVGAPVLRVNLRGVG